jgi:hypothetical protein
MPLREDARDSEQLDASFALRSSLGIGQHF